MEDFSLWLYLAMFGVAFVAGFVDTIAGGGGLITIPALLGAGIAPHAALATNKLQSCFGSGMASWHFIRLGLVDIKAMLAAIFWVFVSAGCGAFAVLLLSAGILEFLIPILLSFILIYTIFSKKLGENERVARLSPFVFYFIFGGIFGFYDGFFGPGTGSFWTFALICLLGMNMKSAVAHTKVLNFASNIFSLFVFIYGGEILWILGLVMGVGQLLGARVGAGFVIKKEINFIRKIFLFVVFGNICKLIYDILA